MIVGGASRSVMGTSAAALAWAASQRFSIFASAEIITAAYAAHLRILDKVAERRAKV